MCFVFQAEDGIRDLVRSRGLGDVYKRQRGTPLAVRKAYMTGVLTYLSTRPYGATPDELADALGLTTSKARGYAKTCLLYTSDAADERSSVDLGGRRIIKKKR